LVIEVLAVAVWSSGSASARVAVHRIVPVAVGLKLGKSSFARFSRETASEIPAHHREGRHHAIGLARVA
jgi:hypothetical protein